MLEGENRPHSQWTVEMLDPEVAGSTPRQVRLSIIVRKKRLWLTLGSLLFVSITGILAASGEWWTATRLAPFALLWEIYHIVQEVHWHRLVALARGGVAVVGEITEIQDQPNRCVYAFETSAGRLEDCAPLPNVNRQTGYYWEQWSAGRPITVLFQHGRPEINSPYRVLSETVVVMGSLPQFRNLPPPTILDPQAAGSPVKSAHMQGGFGCALTFMLLVPVSLLTSLFIGFVTVLQEGGKLHPGFFIVFAVGVVLGIPGWLFLVVVWRAWRLAKKGWPVVGQVLAVDRYAEQSIRVLYRFSIWLGDFANESVVALERAAELRVGHAITVLYLPDDPIENTAYDSLFTHLRVVERTPEGNA